MAIAPAITAGTGILLPPIPPIIPASVIPLTPISISHLYETPLLILTKLISWLNINGDGSIKTYMMTIPRERCSKKRIKVLFDTFDCKKWIIAAEEGKGGYKHWQVRVQSSDPNFFTDAQEMLMGTGAHIEEAQDQWEYERKEGKYECSWDTPEALRQRLGKLRPWQETVLERARTQNDRQIDVWYDPRGNHGKTWLAKHIMETGQGLIIPRADMREPRQCCDFIYRRWKHGMEYLIFDIPRTFNVNTNGIYELIEEVKDGLIFSTKYEGGWVNISGVKVIVFTNNKLDENKLSWDRWRFNKSPPQ